MSVDKNLFLYDLAVVTIMKGEEPYVKEWLDYHILAGVDHFFIYDNGSTPEFKKILQPYIDAEIVTYIFYPGQRRLLEALNAAVRDYKFLCRYMAFVDGDEYLLPKSHPTIVEVVDDIFKNADNAAGVSVNWVMFGSNGLESADYSRGVLERFTRREKNVNNHVKAVVNPRKVDFIGNAHFAIFLSRNFSINENGDIVQSYFNDACTADKIAMFHYHLKSKEEYEKRINRGNVDGTAARKMENFYNWDAIYNEVFDDSIVKYRDERLAAFNCDVKKIPADNESRCEKVFKALTSTLLPGFSEDNPIDFFEDPKNRYEYFDRLVQFFDKAPQHLWEHKAETFLTCFGASQYLKENLLDEYFGNLFEEFSLTALVKALKSSGTEADIQLLIKTLPKILATPYPVVKTIRQFCKLMLPLIMNSHRTLNLPDWKNFVHLDYLLQMLDVFDNYNHK